MKACMQRHLVAIMIGASTCFFPAVVIATVGPGDTVSIEYLDGHSKKIQIGRMTPEYIFVKTQSGGYNVSAKDLSNNTLRKLGMTTALQQREKDIQNSEFRRMQKEKGLVEFRGYWVSPKQKQQILEREESAAQMRAEEAKTQAVARKKAQDAVKAKKSYEAGFKDGYIVGKADAWDGRKRDGMKAMRLGKIHGQDYSAPSQYANGYHEGYNEGWHAARKVGAPVN